ncbi:MAG TPA: hypothetical protein PLM56_04960 [Cyclobacteriaceae bacterium]|jgi:hypothetical protein|nr:hypothetical protein [Cytophagales bacterium]HNT50677.1 hypothetical protein [Cyclobacteriaceae bacterium]HRE66355.1 hypothetical protein [Cyclobacteriaceae bacterium]HRF32823.1 hypothetical protein [Cyclobacteriaceae bacterium]
MVRWIILLCGFTGSAFWFTHVKSTELQFKVTRNDSAVGTLTIQQQVDQDQTTYTLSSDVVVDMIYTIQVSEKITDVYKTGVLHASSHQRQVNGLGRAKNQLTREGDTYQIVNEQNRKRSLSEVIHASVVSIYFNEPKESLWVYSQNFQKMVFMEKTGPHCFSIALPNGNISNYTYEAGMVKTVVTDTFIGTLRFINQNNLSEK